MSTATAPRTWLTFACLGTAAFVGVREVDDLAPAERIARCVVELVDRTCSRFRDDSDLSRVNRSPGAWVAVDPTLAAAVMAACDAAWHTGGLVDPLLGRPMVELGYDRDFGLLAVEPARDPWRPQVPSAAPEAWQEIEVDPAGAVRIPRGTALDLGATGKAWAADLIASAWAEELRGGGVVSLGGDLRIAAPDGTPWPVTVAERPGDDPAVSVLLSSGGLATSTTRVRRWTRHGAEHHHVLDPRTGVSAAEVWRTVTATGPTCTAANAASTAAIVLGHDALGWLAARDVAARLVAADGAVRTVGGWPEQAGEVPRP